MHRPPAVAGSYYPDDASTLAETLDGLTFDVSQPANALGVVVPHAGYVYSGHIAGEVYSNVDLPGRYIMLCPNHTGRGRTLAIMRSGHWETPLGRISLDSQLADALLDLNSDLEVDAEAHRLEHALEVQLPFLQHLTRSSSLGFVPIAVGTSDYEQLERLGRAVAQVAGESTERVMIIASSDMNHYEPDDVTRVKDGKAIDRILDRDSRGLHEVVTRENISMCGFAPTVAMMTAVNDMGARRADLIRYGTSGDIYGDRTRVVGYAGVVVS